MGFSKFLIKEFIDLLDKFCQYFKSSKELQKNFLTNCKLQDYLKIHTN